jgi:uncharacterized membrane protein
MAQELALASAIHLAAVVPAVVIGVAQLASTKGTLRHRILGWIWVLAMTVVAVSSLWIMELRKGAGYSVIHLLSAWVLFCLVSAIWSIRRGNVRAHKSFMIGVMLGVAGAGVGALMPGRFLSQLLF